MTRQERELPLHQAIVDSMVAIWPDSSQFVQLELRRRGTEIGEFSHLFSSEQGTVPIPPDDLTLYDHTYNLDALVREYGGLIQGAVFRVVANVGGNWEWSATFEYAA
jgi:hypothetical protein